MTNQPQLESYLTKLDKALGPIPVGDRADIITEIKSHVTEAIERDPEHGVGSVLASLGEPETVANKYLMDRGLKPGKPPKSPIIKWLTIGFLGTFSIIVLSIGVLIWKFTPIIHVDDTTGRVVLLGGLIDIKGDEGGNGTHGGFRLHLSEDSVSFDGSKAISKTTTDLISIPFTNGKLELSSATDGQLHWECKINKDDEKKANIRVSGRQLILDLQHTRGAKCDIQIPEGTKVALSGSNGKIDLNQLKCDLNVSVGNGNIEFKPASGTEYDVTTTVQNGSADTYKNSSSPNAHKVDLAVHNGRIHIED